MTDIDFAPARGLALSPLMPVARAEGAGHILFLKRGLNRLGFYVPDEKTGMTPVMDKNLMNALYAFQRQATISFDDTDIGPGSTTERLLKRYLAALGDNDRYVWRTVRDDKVRGGQTFLWNEPPEGGHPGEDYNCRCWAVPVSPIYHPWKEWAVNQRAVENLYPDAINPTWSPFDFIGGGALVGAKEISKRLTEIAAHKRVFTRPKGIPKEWIAEAVKKGEGVIYKDPRNPRNYVKIQKARPDSPMPGQQYDNVRWMRNGNSIDAKGMIVDRQSKESHIPLKKFKFIMEKIK